jgi:hypothetical protein
MNNEKDFEVGYKKPPVTTRFKKGQSGNPSGKKKEEEEKAGDEFDPGKILQAIDNETIMVEFNNGKRARMTKVEIHIRQLFKRAVEGSLKEARQIVPLAAKYFGPEAQLSSETRFVFNRSYSNSTDVPKT